MRSSTRWEGGAALSVRGIVSILLTGDAVMPTEAVSGTDAPDVQVKMSRQRMIHTREVRRETVTVREDIRVPQSMPRAEKILSSEAYAVVRTVHIEDMKTIVEGEIRLMVLYLSEDKAAPLQNFYESLPFGQIFDMEGLASDDSATGDAQLYDMQVNIADDAADILRLSAKVSVVCAVRTQTEIELMQDAYSLKNKLDVITERRACRCLAVSGCAKAIARSAITIPDTHPTVSRVICMKAAPIVSAATPGTDRVYLEGLMMFTVCYASPQGMWSYSGETPFEAEAQMEGYQGGRTTWRSSADVEYCAYRGRGQGPQRQVHDGRDGPGLYAERAVDGVRPQGDRREAARSKKGITIYFADGTESVWDIAKRYATTPDTVKRFNPGPRR